MFCKLTTAFFCYSSRRKPAPVRRLNILPKIPRPNPLERESIITERLDRGYVAHHIVVPGFSRRADNLTHINWFLATLQPIVVYWPGAAEQSGYWGVRVDIRGSGACFP